MQRWLKFVKYLREFGWEPVVYTALDAEYPVLDDSLQKDVPEGIEVLRKPIREPYGFYKKFLGKKKDERVFNVFVEEGREPSLKQRLALYVRANFFVPDARFLWIKPSARYLKGYLSEHPVDALVTTGPPHSMHLIGRHLKTALGIPWLADFRDPWTTIDFADDLPYTKQTVRKNERLESEVLRKANHIVVIGEFMREEFTTKTSRPIEVITNGFDPDDFRVKSVRKDPGTFRLVHTGSINKRRNHPVLWKTIADLRSTWPEDGRRLQIALIGKTDGSVLRCLEEYGLMDCTEVIDYLPHDQIAVEQLRADVLLLPINRFGEDGAGFKSAKSTLTGKLFEYLASKNPILAVGLPESQLGNVLAQTRTGRVCGFEDHEAMKDFLNAAYRGELPEPDTTEINRYSRKNLTARMAEILDDLHAHHTSSSRGADT